MRLLDWKGASSVASPSRIRIEQRTKSILPLAAIDRAVRAETMDLTNENGKVTGFRTRVALSFERIGSFPDSAVRNAKAEVSGHE